MRTGTRAAVIVLVVFLVAELFVRSIAGELLPPESNGAGEVALKASQLDARSASGGVDLVVLGDSMIDAGVDPSVVASEVPALARAYNAALRGSRLPTQRLWLTDAVLTRVTPRLVLHGVSPTMVSDLGISPTDVDVFDTMLNNNVRQLKPDFWAELEGIVAERSYLVRYRPSLRSPTIVGTASYNKVTGKTSNLQVDRGAEYWSRITAPSGQNIEYATGVVRSETLAPLFPAIGKLLEGSVQFDSLDKLLATYKARAVRAVIVVPPVAVDVLRAGGIDPARWQASVDQIVARASSQGFHVLDFADHGYPATGFYDLFHLNSKGSAAFSRDLGLALAQLCRSDAGLGCR